jgi:hypothetical protein
MSLSRQSLEEGGYRRFAKTTERVVDALRGPD